MPTGNLSEDLTVSTASDWDDPTDGSDSFPVELPSGKVVRARRTLNILTMLQTGQIPNPLREIVMEGMKNTSPTRGPDLDRESFSDEKTLRQFADLLDSVVIETVVEPPFDRPAPRGEVKNELGVLTNPDESEEDFRVRMDAWTPAEGHVSVFKMHAQDKMFLFAVAQGAVADAKSFREAQEAVVAAVEDEPRPPRPAKRVGGGGTSPKKAPAKKKAPARKKVSAKNA